MNEWMNEWCVMWCDTEQTQLKSSSSHVITNLFQINFAYFVLFSFKIVVLFFTKYVLLPYFVYFYHTFGYIYILEYLKIKYYLEILPFVWFSSIGNIGVLLNNKINIYPIFCIMHLTHNIMLIVMVTQLEVWHAPGNAYCIEVLVALPLIMTFLFQPRIWVIAYDNHPSRQHLDPSLNPNLINFMDCVFESPKA